MTNTDGHGGPAIASNPAQTTLTAFFDGRGEAEKAVERLKDAGVSDVRLTPGYDAETEASPPPEHAGFWAKLEDFLFPDDDRSAYAEGLRRGGFLVSASVDAATCEAAHDILDDEGAIDMDERTDLWRADGWSAPRDQQAAASREDVFQADAAASSATGIARNSRSAGATSPRVRAYEMSKELPDDVVDDVLPTGHQRDVSEDNRRQDGQNQSIDDLRQRQSLPGSR